MSKALKSMDKDERSKAISRRVSGKTMGLGYWSAKEAQVKMGQVKTEIVQSSEVVEETPVDSEVE